MPPNLHRVIPLVLLLSPLLFALLATLFGITVVGRDDNNYLAELQIRRYFLASPDQLSWVALKLIWEIIPDPTLALRLAGFLICLGTCYIMLSRQAGEPAIAYLALSVAPLYWIFYFNQLRTGLGVMLYLLLLVRGRKLVAPFGGALAHSSIIVLLFPPAILIAPFVLDLAELLDPNSFAGVRFAAYRDVDYLLMPWYFGWELILLALVFASEKNFGRVISLGAYAVAVRLLADQLSVDVARRLLEIGILAYSPVVTYLKTRTAPSLQVLAAYVFLGVLSLYVSLTNGVVSFGGP